MLAQVGMMKNTSTTFMHLLKKQVSIILMYSSIRIKMYGADLQVAMAHRTGRWKK